LRRMLEVKPFNVASAFSSTARVRMTAIAACTSSVSIATSTGAIFLFGRDATVQRVVSLLDNPGPVIRVCFSPDEKFIACATESGVLFVIKLGEKDKIVTEVKEHVSAQLHRRPLITVLRWDSQDRLISADDGGFIVFTKISSEVLSRLLPELVAEVFMNVGEPIFQIATDESFKTILVSTQTRTIIAETTGATHTRLGRVAQVGTQRRDEPLGAIFQFRHGPPLNLFAARPNLRLWRASVAGGTVDATLKLTLPGVDVDVGGGVALGQLFAFSDFVLSVGMGGIVLVDPIGPSVLVRSLLSHLLIPPSPRSRRNGFIRVRKADPPLLSTWRTAAARPPQFISCRTIPPDKRF
jgi:hypothetical protein